MVYLRFTLNLEPLSVNKLYGNIPGQARRFISAEGKKFKASVAAAIRDKVLLENLSTDVSNLESKPLEVFISVGLDSWFLKDGKSIRRKDLDNMCKALQDSVFSTLAEFCPKLDDSQIWKLTMEKRISDKPHTVVIINTI